MVREFKPSVGSSSTTTTGASTLAPGKQTRVEAAQASIPGVQLKATASTNATATSSPGDGQLMYMLSTPAPPIGDPVVSYLLALPLPALLDELDEAVACGYARQLEARLAVAPPVLMAALQAGELARTRPITPNHPALHRAGAALDRVSQEVQLQILAWMLARGGVSIEATRLVDGVLALRGAGVDGDEDEPRDGSESDDDAGAHDGSPVGEVAAVQSAGKGMPSPITPDKWRKPGRQPGGLYIGTDAHVRIAAYYADAHRGDLMAFNFTPLTAILDMFRQVGQRGNPGALSDKEGSLKPDILNVSQRHIFEIKPATAQAQGASQVLLYVHALAKAGIEVGLGPSGDPGANGALPAPGGVFQFASPEPGVITYSYNRAKLVPVPVPFAQRAKSKARWRWELRPLKLTPAQEQAVATTTLGGAMLLVAMLLLSPVGI